jgi:hypothetical protein
MPDFNVNTFTSKLKGGGARTNLMWCTMTNNTYTGLNDWQYMCKASQIPASTITAIEVPYFGRMVKVAGEAREFGPLTTTVVQDEGYIIYYGMVAWLEDLNGAASNTTKSGLFKSRSSYTADIKLEMMKKDGTKDQEWHFVNCWPSNMSAIDLNWDTVNTIQEFTIDWQYDYYYHPNAKIGKAA